MIQSKMEPVADHLSDRVQHFGRGVAQQAGRVSHAVVDVLVSIGVPDSGPCGTIDIAGEGKRKSQVVTDAAGGIALRQLEQFPAFGTPLDVGCQPTVRHLSLLRWLVASNRHPGQIGGRVPHTGDQRGPVLEPRVTLLSGEPAGIRDRFPVGVLKGRRGRVQNGPEGGSGIPGGSLPAKSA